MKPSNASPNPATFQSGICDTRPSDSDYTCWMEFLHGRLPVECAPQPCAQQGAELLAAAMPFLKPRDAKNINSLTQETGRRAKMTS